MQLPRSFPSCCRAVASQLPSSCHAIASRLPRSCHAVATRLPRCCHAVVVAGGFRCAIAAVMPPCSSMVSLCHRCRHARPTASHATLQVSMSSLSSSIPSRPVVWEKTATNVHRHLARRNFPRMAGEHEPLPRGRPLEAPRKRLIVEADLLHLSPEGVAHPLLRDPAADLRRTGDAAAGSTRADDTTSEPQADLAAPVVRLEGPPRA